LNPSTNPFIYLLKDNYVNDNLQSSNSDYKDADMNSLTGYLASGSGQKPARKMIEIIKISQNIPEMLSATGAIFWEYLKICLTEAFY
jgi:hypothetical protein